MSRAADPDIFVIQDPPDFVKRCDEILLAPPTKTGNPRARRKKQVANEKQATDPDTDAVTAVAREMVDLHPVLRPGNHDLAFQEEGVIYRYITLLDTDTGSNKRANLKKISLMFPGRGEQLHWYMQGGEPDLEQVCLGTCGISSLKACCPCGMGGNDGSHRSIKERVRLDYHKMVDMGMGEVNKDRPWIYRPDPLNFSCKQVHLLHQTARIDKDDLRRRRNNIRI